MGDGRDGLHEAVHLAAEKRALAAEVVRLREDLADREMAERVLITINNGLREALKEIAEYARAVGMPHIADMARNALKGDA